MMNFLFALIFVSTFFMCGCVSQTLKSQDYKAMLDAYKRQNMVYVDSVLNPHWQANNEKKQHREFVKNLISYHVGNDFVFYCDAVLRIGDCKNDNASKKTKAIVYAIAYGINIDSGIKCCYISPLLKFDLSFYQQGDMVINNLELIDPPQFPLICKQCVHGIKLFPIPRYNIKHVPEAAKFFPLVKLKQIKLIEKQNDFILQSKFLFQMFNRGSGCLHLDINKTAIVPVSKNEFDFITQQEYSGTSLKMLSNAEIVFETNLLNIGKN